MANEYFEGEGSIPCKHDFAGIMVLGVIYAQECRKCEAVLFEKDKIASLVQSWSLLNTLREVGYNEIRDFAKEYSKQSGYPEGQMNLPAISKALCTVITNKLDAGHYDKNF